MKTITALTYVQCTKIFKSEILNKNKFDLNINFF